MGIKRLKLSVLILIGFSIATPKSWAALQPSESDEFNGRGAPTFSVQTLKGNAVSLKGLQGRLVLLNFFASWCPPCRQEIMDLIKLHQKYEAKGLVIIGAATDSKMIPDTPQEKEAADVSKLVGRLKIPYPVTIADQSLIDKYQFKGIPTIVFITKQGGIAKIFYGYHSLQQLEGVIKELLAGKET